MTSASDEDRPSVLDELAAALAALPPMGAWVLDASCGDLGLDAADVFTQDRPDPDELAVAERVCRRCPVRRECADYAARTPVYGVWGGTWHGEQRKRQQAA